MGVVKNVTMIFVQGKTFAFTFDWVGKTKIIKKKKGVGKTNKYEKITFLSLQFGLIPVFAPLKKLFLLMQS